jgi:hypothetical protein
MKRLKKHILFFGILFLIFSIGTAIVEFRLMRFVEIIILRKHSYLIGHRAYLLDATMAIGTGALMSLLIYCLEYAHEKNKIFFEIEKNIKLIVWNTYLLLKKNEYNEKLVESLNNEFMDLLIAINQVSVFFKIGKIDKLRKLNEIINDIQIKFVQINANAGVSYSEELKKIINNSIVDINWMINCYVSSEKYIFSETIEDIK